MAEPRPEGRGAARLVGADDPGRERADFVLGDRDGSTLKSAFTQLVADTLRQFGYAVAINDPYKGVEIVRKHGCPVEHRHSLQLEIKRRLYMDEQTFEPIPAFLRLEADLARLTATIAGRLRERLGIPAAPLDAAATDR